MSAKATCTWGDGPDVMISVMKTNKSGFDYVDVSDKTVDTKGSFGLTADEAIELAKELIDAAVLANKYFEGYNHSCYKMEIEILKKELEK